MYSNLKSLKNHWRYFVPSSITIVRSGMSMHFVGKDFQDDYSTVLKEYVNNFDLNTSVLSMMLNMTFSIFYLNQLLEYWLNS
jgi:hypothetical protein